MIGDEEQKVKNSLRYLERVNQTAVDGHPTGEEQAPSFIPHDASDMAETRSLILQGTLDLMVLKTRRRPSPPGA